MFMSWNGNKEGIFFYYFFLKAPVIPLALIWNAFSVEQIAQADAV